MENPGRSRAVRKGLASALQIHESVSDERRREPEIRENKGMESELCRSDSPLDSDVFLRQPFTSLLDDNTHLNLT